MVRGESFKGNSNTTKIETEKAHSEIESSIVQRKF